MTEKYDYNDAGHMTWIIHKRRPDWSKPGIMKQFERAASRGATLGQAMTAAEKATQNKKADTPAAILFEEYWLPEGNSTNAAGNLMAPRLCVECATKHPVTEMTKHAHGWVCNQHTEEGNK